MAWEQSQGEKLGLLVPSRGEVSIEWALMLSSITHRARMPVQTYVSKHYRIDFSRNDLVEAALGDGCTRLFFLDSDTFPCSVDATTGEFRPFGDVIPRLASHQYPIVSGLYWTKKQEPNLYSLTPGKVSRFEAVKGDLSTFAGVLSFVDAVGLGCCMIDARVFGALPYPWFEYRRTTVEGERLEISEDVAFCLAARKAGFGILADGAVVCKHETRAFLTWGGDAELHPVSERRTSGSVARDDSSSLDLAKGSRIRIG